MSEYYVYTARVGVEIIYVGSGKGDRYKHVNSGNSHNKALNLLVSQGVKIDVQIVARDMEQCEARACEQELINIHKPLFNKSVAASTKTIVVNKELQKIGCDPNPTTEMRQLARLLYNHAILVYDINRCVQSFIISMSDRNGYIEFTETQLRNFLEKYWKYGGWHDLKHHSILNNVKVYKFTLKDILRQLGFEQIQNEQDMYTKRLENCSKSFSEYNRLNNGTTDLFYLQD